MGKRKRKAFLRKFANRMKRNPTESEAAFFEILGTIPECNDIVFQQIFNGKREGYIADFYVPHLRLVFEIDGGYHQTLKQAYKDLYRTEWFDRKGMSVVRFQNGEVKNGEKCKERIQRELSDRADKIRKVTKLAAVSCITAGVASVGSAATVIPGC